jgi:hypothetical protein
MSDASREQRKLQKMRLLSNMMNKTIRKVGATGGGRQRKTKAKSYEEAPVPPPQVKIKKPRPPATGRRKEWQETFSAIRRKYPGKATPQYYAELRKAGQDFRARKGSTPRGGGQKQVKRRYEKAPDSSTFSE